MEGVALAKLPVPLLRKGRSRTICGKVDAEVPVLVGLKEPYIDLPEDIFCTVGGKVKERLLADASLVAGPLRIFAAVRTAPLYSVLLSNVCAYLFNLTLRYLCAKKEIVAHLQDLLLIPSSLWADGHGRKRRLLLPDDRAGEVGGLVKVEGQDLIHLHHQEGRQGQECRRLHQPPAELHQGHLGGTIIHVYVDLLQYRQS